MTASQTWNTASAEQTETVAAAVGARLRGGEVIELNSDLGGGKTTFVRGLARGAGSTDHVASPTFTVSREYGCPDGLVLHHYDFYRLGEDAGIMADELSEVLQDYRSVVIVEWSQAVAHVLPAEHIVISLHRTGDEGRRIEAIYPQEAAYLIQGVSA